MLADHAKIPTQHHLTPRRIQTVNSFLKETLQYLEAGEWLWQKAWACLSGNIARSAIWPLNILNGLQRRKGMWAREKKGWSGCSPFIYRYSTSSVTTSTNTDPRSAHSDGAVMGHYTECSWHWSHDRGTLRTHSKLSVFWLMLNWAQISRIPRESCARRFNHSQTRADPFPFINRRSSTQGPRFLQRSIFSFRRWDSICTCWCVVETGRRKCVWVCVCFRNTPRGSEIQGLCMNNLLTSFPLLLL